MPDPVDLAGLAERFGGRPFPLGIEVPPASLVPVLRELRGSGHRGYVLATATQREATFEVVHGVRDAQTGSTVFVKAAVPAGDPRVPSAVPVYAGADWYERELYDLFGIVFEGHPDLRRLLMPDEYVGHPLRKEFPMDAPWGYRPGGAGGGA